MTVRTRCAETLAILLEDEPSPVAQRRARVHAASCPQCSAALDDPGAASRLIAVRRATAPRPRAVVLVVLASLSVVQLALALPWLFGVNATVFLGHADSAHLARDGALGIAVAAAGLTASRRPDFASALTVVCSCAIAVHVIVGVVDTEDHAVAFPFELSHAIELAIFVLVVAIARPRLRHLHRQSPVSVPKPQPPNNSPIARSTKLG